MRKEEPDTFASNATLAEDLKSRHISRVVNARMQSNHCVAATREAGMDNGFDVILASGWARTYDEDKPAAVNSAEIEEAPSPEGVVAVPASAVRCNYCRPQISSSALALGVR